MLPALAFMGDGLSGYDPEYVAPPSLHSNLFAANDVDAALHLLEPSA